MYVAFAEMRNVKNSSVIPEFRSGCSYLIENRIK